MKKLYRKGTVHPSPSHSPSPSPSPISDQLSLSYLPAAILTLAAALTADDKEVLAYLLSCSAASDTRKKPQHHPHPPSSACCCFSCYTSFWARWDSSPNRHLIHQIIDALEDGFFHKKQGFSKREKRRNTKNSNKSFEMNNERIGCDAGSNGSSTRVNSEQGRIDYGEEENGEETGEKEGSVRKIVSFIGERIWGTVWGSYTYQ